MNQSDRDYSEKRDFIRMHVETPATLSIDGQSFMGTCLDLSSIGMQIRTESTFQIGDRLAVHISSAHSELKGLDAQTEVVRISVLEDGSQSLGLAILTID